MGKVNEGMPEKDALGGKTIVLGVTGSIAAYKAVEIARLLIASGAAVKVAMTEAATRFVTPLTFQVLTGHRVICDALDAGEDGAIEHVALGRDADAVLIAPATANTLAEIACGIANDAVTSIVLATDKPVVVAPSMNCRMYNNEATRANMDVLRRRGYEIVGPAEGWLACGDEGVGRLAEPAVIAEKVIEVLKASAELKGKKILITAGGTREPLDPVRYLGNRSSGRMGFEVAKEAVRRGAEVMLVTGPTSLMPPAGIDVKRVTTAKEMLSAVLDAFDESDALVMAAAVSDFRPFRRAESKIKKGRETVSVVLEPTADILKEVAARRKNQIIFGFAAETERVLEEARRKMREKGLDLIVANDVSRGQAGFEADKIDATILTPDGPALDLGIVEKREVARLIVNRLVEALCRT